MYFTKDTNLFGKRLYVFRKCFSKPQRTHFKTYLHGLLLGKKGEKNIEDIASNVLDGKHQSSLNRFNYYEPRIIINIFDCPCYYTGFFLAGFFGDDFTVFT